MARRRFRRLLRQCVLAVLAVVLFLDALPAAAQNSPPAEAQEQMQSSDATLSGLALEAGDGTAIELTPAFAAGRTAYQISVPLAVTGVKVTATANDAGATLTVNGASVASGSKSALLALATNTGLFISVRVTAADGSTQSYSITIERPASEVRNLVAVPGAGVLNLSWDAPSFGGTGGTGGYAVRYRAKTADDSAAWQPSDAGIGAGDATGPGRAVVPDLDPATTYEVEVWVRTTLGAGVPVTATGVPLDPSGLSGLTVATGDGTAIPLAPAFDAATYSYKAVVPLAATVVRLTATAVSPAASLTLDGAALTSGAPSAPVTVEVNKAKTVRLVGTRASGGRTLTSNYSIELVRVPSAVRDLEAKPFAGFLKLAWTGPEFEGTNTAGAEYRVRYREVPGTGQAGPWQPDDAGQVVAFTQGAAGGRIDGLVPLKTYEVQVWLRNSGGDGAVAATRAQPLADDHTLTALTLTAADGTNLPLRFWSVLARSRSSGVISFPSAGDYERERAQYSVQRFRHTAFAPDGVTGVRLTATAGDPDATITVEVDGGSAVTLSTGVQSGVLSLPAPQPSGEPTGSLLEVKVTDSAGVERVYVIDVVRGAKPVRDLEVTPRAGSLALSWTAPEQISHGRSGVDNIHRLHFDERVWYRVRWRPISGDGAARWMPDADGVRIPGQNSQREVIDGAYTVEGLAAGVVHEVEVRVEHLGGRSAEVRGTGTIVSADSALLSLTLAAGDGTAIPLEPVGVVTGGGDSVPVSVFRRAPGGYDVAGFTYLAAAPPGATGVRVTATARDPGATLTVDGAAAVSGEPSGLVALEAGRAKAVVVTVTASDGVTATTHTVNVARPPGAVRDLAVTPGVRSLALSWLAPTFAGTHTVGATYRLRWRPTTGGGTGGTSGTGTGTGTGGGPWLPGPAGVAVRYAPGAGSHTIGDLNPSLTYEVQVWAENRGGAGPSAGASGSPLLATAVPLSALTVVDDGGAALPLRLALVRTTGGQSVTGDAYEQDPAAHDAAFYAFVASAPPAATGVRVTATARDPAATLTIDGAPATSGSPSALLTLAAGKERTVTVTVTAGAATTTFTITLTRSPGPVRDLAVVPGARSLALSWKAPAFAGTQTAGATYRVRWRPSTAGAPWQPDLAGLAVAPKVGAGGHTIDGLDPTLTYEVQVWAANAGGAGATESVQATSLAGDAGGAGLWLTDTAGAPIPLSPAFDPATLRYVASVPLAASGVRVTVAAADPEARLAVNGVPAVSGEPSGLPAMAARTASRAWVEVSAGGESVSYTVELTRPPAAVANLKATRAGVGKLSLSWDAPDFAGSHTDGSAYRVRWRPVTDDNSAAWLPDAAGRAVAAAGGAGAVFGATSVVIEGLERSVAREVQVWAQNSGGAGVPVTVEATPTSNDSRLASVVITDDAGNVVPLSISGANFNRRNANAAEFRKLEADLLADIGLGSLNFISFEGSVRLGVTGLRFAVETADPGASLKLFDFYRDNSELLTTSRVSPLLPTAESLAAAPNRDLRYRYEVTASDGVTKTTYWIGLFGATRGQFATNLRATPGLGSLAVSWVMGNDRPPSTATSSFRIRWRPKTDDNSAAWLPGEDGRAVASLGPGAPHSHTIEGLTPSTAYEVQVWLRDTNPRLVDHVDHLRSSVEATPLSSDARLSALAITDGDGNPIPLEVTAATRRVGGGCPRCRRAG